MALSTFRPNKSCQSLVELEQIILYSYIRNLQRIDTPFMESKVKLCVCEKKSTESYTNSRCFSFP